MDLAGASREELLRYRSRIDELLAATQSPEGVVKVYGRVPESGYARNYGRCLKMLRDECSRDARTLQPKMVINDAEVPIPLTIRESLLARIEDFERLRNPDSSERTVKERLKLFRKGFYGSNGILWEYGGDMLVPLEKREAIVPLRAKISTVCRELLSLKQYSNGVYLKVPDFESFEGELVDLTQGKWDQYLTEPEVPEHEGWRKLVGDDEEGIRVLKSYARVVYSNSPRGEATAMAFYKRSTIKTNELRASWVYNLNLSSNANGNYNLNLNAAFLRVSQAP